MMHHLETNSRFVNQFEINNELRKSKMIKNIAIKASIIDKLT